MYQNIVNIYVMSLSNTETWMGGRGVENVRAGVGDCDM